MVHSIVPLAVLEAVKNLDTPVEDGLSEFAEELLVKRLGLSPTVAMQLAEFEQLVRKDARVEPAHVEALLRLVGRRPDADLVFADAGRRAARRAVRRLSGVSRFAAHSAPRVFGRWSGDGRKGLIDGLDLRGAPLDLLSARRHGSFLFLRYSLATFLRFWLARLIYEQQTQTDRIVRQTDAAPR